MTTPADLPAPLTPADCDLQDFKFMPLDVARLRDSDMASEQTPEENWAAVLLWAACWHQVPAGSMPDSENWIAKAAGYMSRGRVDPHWADVKAGAMRGFVLCSDGRWYHPVVAEKANESWIGKLKQRLKTECSRIKKHNDRNGTKIAFPEFDAWFAAGCPVGQPLGVPRDITETHQGQKEDGQVSQVGDARSEDQNPGQKALNGAETGMSLGTSNSVPGDIGGMSLGTTDNVPSETASKRQGEGQGEYKSTPKPPIGGSKGKAPRIELKTFLEDCKAKGERPLRDYKPLWAYVEDARLPMEYVALAWVEFMRRFGVDGVKQKNRQADWRQTFRNYVERNYLRLWAIDADGNYYLTTQGRQAQITAESKEAA